MDLNSIVVILFLIGFNLFFYEYFVKILNKFYPKILVDDQFKKPQAFHDYPISTTGGLGIYVSFLIIFFNLFFFKSTLFSSYLYFCTLFFLVGFAEDIIKNIFPKIRLLIMIIFLVILIQYTNLKLDNTGITVINELLNNSEIFSLFFICLCFLFIINGTNLIDGYNGLLGIHSFIIIINLFFINLFNGNNELSYLLFMQLIILLIFLKYNFPKARVFLGDGGSYFLGAFIALSTIKTSIANPEISPFYFCILLFYLFFEVFFSFLRKILKEKKSPILPDKKHLHMLLYKILLSKNKNKVKSNYYVSIIINLVYLILIAPATLMMGNSMFCKYYSLVFFITYIIFYKIAYAKNK
jgi:UDP-N-acetylmuramyl pentapeptide phosphotransferase/UDP-N-acetylglucosamine-1-phosphate transferase